MFNLCTIMFTIVFVIIIGAIKCSFISFITVALAFTLGNSKFVTFSDTFDSFPLNFTVYTLNFSISLLYLLIYLRINFTCQYVMFTVEKVTLFIELNFKTYLSLSFTCTNCLFYQFGDGQGKIGMCCPS